MQSVIKEFKATSRLGLNRGAYGNYGILTTTVPWPDISGGKVHQNLKQYGKATCERYEKC